MPEGEKVVREKLESAMFDAVRLTSRRRRLLVLPLLMKVGM